MKLFYIFMPLLSQFLSTISFCAFFHTGPAHYLPQNSQFAMNHIRSKRLFSDVSERCPVFCEVDDDVIVKTISEDAFHFQLSSSAFLSRIYSFSCMGCSMFHHVLHPSDMERQASGMSRKSFLQPFITAKDIPLTLFLAFSKLIYPSESVRNYMVI